MTNTQRADQEPARADVTQAKNIVLVRVVHSLGWVATVTFVAFAILLVGVAFFGAIIGFLALPDKGSFFSGWVKILSIIILGGVGAGVVLMLLSFAVHVVRIFGPSKHDDLPSQTPVTPLQPGTRFRITQGDKTFDAEFLGPPSDTKRHQLPPTTISNA